MPWWVCGLKIAWALYVNGTSKEVHREYKSCPITFDTRYGTSSRVDYMIHKALVIKFVYKILHHLQIEAICQMILTASLLVICINIINMSKYQLPPYINKTLINCTSLYKQLKVNRQKDIHLGIWICKINLQANLTLCGLTFYSYTYKSFVSIF
jgi:hypothetical protein